MWVSFGFPLAKFPNGCVLFLRRGGGTAFGWFCGVTNLKAINLCVPDTPSHGFADLERHILERSEVGMSTETPSSLRGNFRAPSSSALSYARGWNSGASRLGEMGLVKKNKHALFYGFAGNLSLDIFVFPSLKQMDLIGASTLFLHVGVD